MTTIVVAGALANKARNGGEAWVRLSWIRGLQQLGVDVRFVEQIDQGTCTDSAGAPATFAASANAAYFESVVARFGLVGRAALLRSNGDESVGATVGDVVEWIASSDAVINISGHLPPRVLAHATRRVYVDIDPGFTQFWAASSALDLTGHDVYVTIGENIGRSDCAVPTCGIEWQTTRQPVVLEDWPLLPCDDSELFTTIANWRGPYGAVEFSGRRYGLKVHEFRKFAGLPRVARQRFEAALNIAPEDAADREMLVENGWTIVDPRSVAGTPDAFRRYVQASGGEFSVAQGIYVDTNSGWFSDRTVRYLASGRPVLVQDTGFSRWLPTGDGLVAFRSFGDAVDGAARIAADYEAHSDAARAVAASFFAPGVVLNPLLDRVLSLGRSRTG